MDYRGYWLNSNSGKMLSTSDHGSSIIKNPELFGMSKKYVSGIMVKKPYNSQSTGTTDTRVVLMSKAFENGWVRIRIVNSSWTVEFAGDMTQVVGKFIKKFKDDMGPFTRINLHNLHTHDNRSMGYNDLVTAYESGNLSDEQSSIRSKLRQRMFVGAGESGEEKPNFSLESLRRRFNRRLFKSA